MCSRCILYTVQKLQGKLLLWAWILGTDGKFGILHLWKLDSCGLKSALEKTSGSFISSLQRQLWSAFEFFEWNRLFAIPCCEVFTQYSWLNQVNRGHGSQNSQNSWLRHLFSWKGAVCPHCVFYTAQNLQGKLPLWAWLWEPDGKSSIFPLWKSESSSLKPTQKALCFTYLLITTKTLVNHLSFLKETGCLPVVAGKSSESSILHNMVINCMTVNTYRTFFPDIFTHERVQCVLVVSFTLLRSCGESWFCEPGWWDLMAKAVLFSCES